MCNCRRHDPRYHRSHLARFVRRRADYCQLDEPDRATRSGPRVLEYDYYLKLEEMAGWYEPLVRVLEFDEATRSGWNESGPYWKGGRGECFYTPPGRSCDEMLRDRHPVVKQYKGVRPAPNPPEFAAEGVNSGWRLAADDSSGLVHSLDLSGAEPTEATTAIEAPVVTTQARCKSYCRRDAVSCGRPDCNACGWCNATSASLASAARVDRRRDTAGGAEEHGSDHSTGAEGLVGIYYDRSLARDATRWFLRDLERFGYRAWSGAAMRFRSS